MLRAANIHIDSLEKGVMTIRRFHLVAVLVCLAAAIAGALGSAPGAQAAGKPQIPAHGKLIGSFTPQELITKSEPVPNLAKPLNTSPKKCVAVPANSAAGRAGATTACLQRTFASGSASSSAVHANTVRPDDATCTMTDPGTWTYYRLDYCLSGLQFTYTEYGGEGSTEVIGTGVLTINTSAELSAYSGEWQETQAVSLATTGEVTYLNVGITASCDASCTAIVPNPWPGSSLLGDGQSANGSVTFESTPGPGNISNITTSYDINVTQPGATPISTDATWWNPEYVRCDMTFASDTSTGCAIPAVRPEFTLSLAQYGAAAALYGIAEQVWNDEWGSSANPLHREASDSVQESNREYTCGDKASRAFVYDYNTVPNDSCDEYPFAASSEGGTNGGFCADVFPLFEDGVWQVFQDPNAPTVTKLEPCLRGHVDSDLNSNAGLALGRFSQDQRVVPYEAYTVSITP